MNRVYEITGMIVIWAIIAAINVVLALLIYGLVYKWWRNSWLHQTYLYAWHRLHPKYIAPKHNLQRAYRMATDMSRKEYYREFWIARLKVWAEHYGIELKETEHLT